MNLRYFYDLYEKTKKELEENPAFIKAKKEIEEIIAQANSTELLSEQELKEDLETLLAENNASGDAWGQHPATSYSNTPHGFANLRKMVNLMAERINSYKQDGFPDITVSNERVFHFYCGHCQKNWYTSDFDKSHCSLTCPFCAYLGQLKPKERA